MLTVSISCIKVLSCLSKNLLAPLKSLKLPSLVNENFVKADDANLWSPEATRRHGGFNFGKEEVAGCLDQLFAENEEEELRSILLSLGQIDVAEVYSPERITKRAGEFGLQKWFGYGPQRDQPFYWTTLEFH